MPSCQWPQPELSIGEQHGSMDIRGRYKCWIIKEKSPAQLVWRDIFSAIVTLLEEQFENSDARDEDLMVEMFMIGREISTCSPTTLFSSQCKTSRRRAMDLVQKQGVLALCPGVLMAECARLPRSLATDSSSTMELSTGVYVNRDLRHCGISVLIVGPHGGPPRRATMGGIPRIGEVDYGLIVNYPFSKALEGKETGESDIQFPFYGLSEHDDDSSGDGTFFTDGTIQGSISSTLTQSQICGDLNSSRDGPLTASQEVLSNGAPTMRHSERMGIDFLLSPDYLLRETDTQLAQTQLPYLIGDSAIDPPQNQALDWTLVNLDLKSLIRQAEPQSILDILTNKFNTESRAIYPVITAATEPKDRRVLIGTGTSSVMLEGKLSSVPSFKKSVDSQTFVELWTVTCHDGNFFDGDGGSWVMDSELNILYGLVIAGYPGTNTAYLIPMVRIVENIERLFGSVTIPTYLGITTKEDLQDFQSDRKSVEGMKIVVGRSDEWKSLLSQRRKLKPLVTKEYRQFKNEAHHSEMNQNNAPLDPILAPTPRGRWDNNGVQWTAFNYTFHGVMLEYTIRCDIESININNLDSDFKTANCVYPDADSSEDQYRGTRFTYETKCNTLGWALAGLNPCLRVERDLLLKAIDAWCDSNPESTSWFWRFRCRSKL